MQITTNPAPTRAPALLLALLAAAGLALTGCGDDSSTTTPAPAPAPPVTAPPAPDPVAVPGGLKVTAAGHDHLEFGWEAVEGATAYEIQLSTTEGDFGSVLTATVTTTMHRFTVAAETTGYARVRAHEGERQSDWSETASGTSTAAPVPPLVLSAPTPTVSSTGPDHIEWSWEPVADALAYEVRVAATVDGLDAASSSRTTETMHRVDAEPEMEMHLRVRAAAGTPESPITSDWSDAVSGMSDAAPRPFVVSMTPPEAAADRTCGGQAFCPDRGTDAKTARASVNPKMLVSSSHAARVTPMFVEGVSGVTVEAGEAETPFAYADGWDALQTTVAGDGVTFEFRQITVGAGQEPMPTGEAMYITCGPFRCSAAADAAPAAPEITLADSDACEGVEVDLELIKGVRFNAYQRVPDGGVDIGWQYTSTHSAKVTHEFDLGNAVMSVPGYDLEATSVKVWLDLLPHADAENPINKFGGPRNRDTTEFAGNPDYASYAASAPWTANLRTADDPGPIRNGPWDCVYPASLARTDRAWEGWDYAAATRSFDTEIRDRVRRPPSDLTAPYSHRYCARLVTDGLYTPYGWGRSNPEWQNYLPGYRVHVDPQGGVSWAGSRVTDWGKEHPFETLSCERVTFPVADQLDLCEDFREEVNDWWGGGLKGSDPPFRVEYESSREFGGADPRAWFARLTHIVIRPSRNVRTDQHNQQTYRPDGSRHLNLWLVRGEEPGGANDAPDGTMRDVNLYWQRVPPAPNDGEASDYHNLSRRAWGAPRDWISVPRWRAPMFIEIHDEDGDPQHGDIGKVDLFTGDTCLEGGSPSFGPCRDSRGSDGNPDNYGHANNGGPNPDADRCTDDDGGKGCDAVVDFDLSASFTRIRDTDSCVETIETSITCTWLADADGRMARTGTRGREASRRNWYDYDRLGRIQNDFIHCEPN